MVSKDYYDFHLLPFGLNTDREKNGHPFYIALFNIISVGYLRNTNPNSENSPNGHP